MTSNPVNFSDSARNFSGRRSRRVRKVRELTAEGRAALVAAILRSRPWLKSTGPRTPEGKARSARNGLVNRRLWRVVSRRTEHVETGPFTFDVVTVTRYANGHETRRVVPMIVIPRLFRLPIAIRNY